MIQLLVYLLFLIEELLSSDNSLFFTLRISNLDNMINSLTEEIAVRNYYKKEEEN